MRALTTSLRELTSSNKLVATIPGTWLGYKQTGRSAAICVAHDEAMDRRDRDDRRALSTSDPCVGLAQAPTGRHAG